MATLSRRLFFHCTFPVTAACLLGGAPAATPAATVSTYTNQASFTSAAAGIPLGTQSFEGFAPGTCLDVYCGSDGVGGVTFSSPNGDCGECDYVPIGIELKSDGDGGNKVLGGGYTSFGRGQTDTTMVLHFDPPVVAFSFDLLHIAPLQAASIEIEFADGSPTAGPYDVGEEEGAAFFGAISDTPVSAVEINPASTAIGGQAEWLQEARAPGSGHTTVVYNDVIVGGTLFGNSDIGDYALDNLTHSVPPPRCERINLEPGATSTIEGQATAGAGSAGIDTLTLVTDSPEHLTLASEFDPGDSPVEFSVLFDGAVDAAAGTVVATDFEGSSCTLVVDFRELPEGPLVNQVVCQDDGILLQISNPPPEQSGPATPAGTSSCSGQLPDPENFPPGYEASPDDDPFPCRELIIDSPVTGPTDMIYKKDGAFDPRLRLLFSEFDEQLSEFPPYHDITISIEEIAEVVPDPVRLHGVSQWTPVRITCAILEPDCTDPLLDGLDFDQDGFPLCENGLLGDCNDQLAAIHPDANEGPCFPSTCNGLDDDCDDEIDEGFDPDGDGHASCFDNCPFDYNPTQADADGDGVGDACADDEGEDEDEDSDFDFAPHVQALATPQGSVAPQYAGSSGDPSSASGAQAPARPQPTEHKAKAKASARRNRGL